MTWSPGDKVRRLLEARYLRRDASGQLVESPDELLSRVARGVAEGERGLASTARDGEAAVARWSESYRELLAGLRFLPNSPTLMNAGLPAGQLSACFVLPLHCEVGELFDSLRLAALIQQTGGGTGFDFSRLHAARPSSTGPRSPGELGAGPVEVLRLFDQATDCIRHGGRRRGANMGVLRVDHPELESFLQAKQAPERHEADGGTAGPLRNFNLSVAVTDDFLRAALDGGEVALRDPLGAELGHVPASPRLDAICQAAWACGDPGLLMLDAIARANPTPDLGPIEATNPCGEVPLLPYEPCNLGSLNLPRFVRDPTGSPAIDWEELARATRLAVRFLDDVIEACGWPDPRIRDAARGNRKIGLGVMGFAELLIRLGVPYGSDESVSLAGELLGWVAEHALDASRALAAERGPFPNWRRSVHSEDQRPPRHATRTAIAPTGAISLIAGTSSGIEPLFALAFRRQHILEGQAMVEVSPVLIELGRRQGWLSDAVLRRVAESGTLADSPEAPESAARLFRTALELPAESHLRVQAACQRHVDNGVSKTINLPRSATVEEVRAIYLRAFELGLKGVTVFRQGCGREATLSPGGATCPPCG